MNDRHAIDDARFAAALDAIVRGERIDDPDPLVGFARALQATEGAPNGDPLDAGRRTTIWQDLIAGQTRVHPTTGGPGPLSQPALAPPAHPWLPRRGASSRSSGFLPPAGRLQPFVTAMALVALLLAAWSGFATFREGGAPPVTPTASAHGVSSPTAFAPSMRVRDSDVAMLRQRPAVPSDEAVPLPPGSPLEALDAVDVQDERWMMVRTEQGDEGWVRQRDLEPILGPDASPTPTPRQ
jgi:hypothetical protein